MTFLLEFQESIYKPWQIEYVAYEAIHEGLYVVCTSGHWTVKDERDFESAIRLEAGKVDLFINRKQREMGSRIAHCQRLLLSQQNLMDDTTRASTDNQLLAILADINELAHYTRVNFKALENLIQEHDRITNTNCQSLLVEVCRTRPLDNQRFDSILVQVSSLLDISRKKPFTFSKANATKLHIKRDYKNSPLRARYWVHQDNITEVKAILLFNLPIYISEPALGFEQTEQSESAVYLDTNKFSQYSARLQCDDGAQVISCKWQGALANTNQVCVERKIFVKTDQGGGGSVIDRITMHKNRIHDFLSQSYTAEEYAQDLKSSGFDQDHIDSCYAIAQSIQKSVSEKQLGPKLRVFFNRLLFQSPQDNTLSVSLDNNVAFVREDENRINPGEWCRQDIDVDYPFKSVDAEDINLFPHAILETQIIDTSNGETPQWLSKLLDSKLLFEVPRFSTYIHGVAQFWSPLLPLLPWWLSHIDSDIRAGKQAKLLIEGAGQVSDLSRSNSSRPLKDGQYRMGYLESQLGKKGDSRHRFQASNRQDGDNISSGNLKSRNNFILQVEDIADNNSGHSIQSSRTMKTRIGLSRYPESISSQAKERYSFIDYYYKGRNNKSQAYMLQDTDTVKDNDEIRKAAIIEMGEEKEKKKKKGKKAKPPSHTMEPKVFFANERTFIHWLQFSALILTAALTLLNFGDRISTIAGATFFGVSLVIAIYAFLRNRYRAHQISTRPSLRYDDLYGPIGLCCLLIGAMALNFVLRWQHPNTPGTYLGINNKTDQQTSNQTI